MARCIYTAVFGGYEEFCDREVVGDSIDRICFTDDRELRSEHWEVRVVDPLFPSDPVRSARAVKILSHEYVGEYDETLWVDNSVELTSRPEAILDQWLDRVDVAMPTHSFRATVLDEFAAVIEAGRDDETRVYDQLFHYSYDYPRVLEERPYWTAISARRQGQKVVDFERRWFAHVLRYSRRDQLSVNLAIGLGDVVVQRIEIDNHDSDVARWPRMSRYAVGERRNPVSPVDVRLSRAELQRADLREQIAHRDRLLEAQAAALRQAGLDCESLEVRLALREVELERVYESRSWRWAHGLRRARDMLGRQTT